MQYTVTRGEKEKVEVKVDIPKAGFEASYNQVLAQLGKDAKIGGFRPGKAPADVVGGHFGLAKVLNETASFLISKHLSEILGKENLVPLDSPKIAIGSLAKDASFSFTASFTQKPQVKVGNWRTIKIKKVKAKEVSDEDVAASIKNIYEAWVKQKSKVKSPAYAEASVGRQKSKVEEGVEEEESTSKKFIYDAHGNKVFLKDDPTSSTSEESRPTSEVKQAPDDNFAKAVGARDLVHLREIVKKDLETIVADQLQVKLEQDIFEKLVEICTIEVPEVLVEDELSRILIRLTNELERQGKSLENYLSDEKTTLAELKTKWRPQAEKNVKVSLILEHIGKNEKIQVTAEEVQQALKGVSQTDLSDDQKRDLENYIAFSIFQAKTLDLVKKTVTS